MKITVTAPFKKAVFTWSDDLQDCNLESQGFDNDEIKMLMDVGAHEGADAEGYAVDIH